MQRDREFKQSTVWSRSVLSVLVMVLPLGAGVGAQVEPPCETAELMPEVNRVYDFAPTFLQVSRLVVDGGFAYQFHFIVANNGRCGFGDGSPASDNGRYFIKFVLFRDPTPTTGNPEWDVRFSQTVPSGGSAEAFWTSPPITEGDFCCGQLSADRHDGDSDFLENSEDDNTLADNDITLGFRPGIWAHTSISVVSTAQRASRVAHFVEEVPPDWQVVLDRQPGSIDYSPALGASSTLVMPLPPGHETRFFLHVLAPAQVSIDPTLRVITPGFGETRVSLVPELGATSSCAFALGGHVSVRLVPGDTLAG